MHQFSFQCLEPPARHNELRRGRFALHAENIHHLELPVPFRTMDNFCEQQPAPMPAKTDAAGDARAPRNECGVEVVAQNIGPLKMRPSNVSKVWKTAAINFQTLETIDGRAHVPKALKLRLGQHGDFYIRVLLPENLQAGQTQHRAADPFGSNHQHFFWKLGLHRKQIRSIQSLKASEPESISISTRR